MVELESEDCQDKVPVGLKFSPANFLSAPTDEEFRGVIETDNDQHQIIKINKKEGKFPKEILPFFWHNSRNLKMVPFSHPGRISIL